MKEGDRGFCFVRKIENGAMVLDTYGRSTGFCIDPIEKKPLNHFYPGTSVLSFGTAGCNLGCQFCQNWDISKSREVSKLSQEATPDSIAAAASHYQCRSVAFTYNDPVVWAEYAIDTAMACRDRSIATVAVTAGYIEPQARHEFFRWMDAANVDLKAFSEEFYRKITYSRLEPVLDTLRYLKHETDVWFELTNLVIPGANDSQDEIQRMCDWIVKTLGPDVPIHFSAFHPDFRMMDRPATPHQTLLDAYLIAKSHGINHVYVGNVHDPKHSSTYCPGCGEMLIERDWYEIRKVELIGDRCKDCQRELAGRFQSHVGTWGRKRLPIDMRPFQSITPLTNPLSVKTKSLLKPVSSSATAYHSGITDNAMQNPNIEKLPVLNFQSLSDEQRKTIQDISAKIVAAKVLKLRVNADIFDALGDLAGQYVTGCFTTLKRGKTLRGCCGFLGRPTTLRDALTESAERTAKEDPRMPAIASVELPFLSCHVTLLSAPFPCPVPSQQRDNAIEIGKHGLRISSKANSVYGQRAGLLLPSVPVEQGWNVVQYLEGVCRKASLPNDAWKDPSVELDLFEGMEIGGSFRELGLPEALPEAYVPGDFTSLMKLKGAVVQNMIAFSHGATPNYYVLDAMDGTVHGIVLSAVDLDTQTPMAHWIQTSLRPGIPLQSTVFDLSRIAEETLRRTRFDKSVDIDIAVSVLYSPAHHGTLHLNDWDGGKLHDKLSDCDLNGIDPTQRGILAMCGERVAVAFDKSKTPHELVQEAAAMVKSRTMPITIISQGCMSTASSLLASNIPGVDPSDRSRKAVLGGSFYPANHDELQNLLSQFESNSKAESVTDVRAIMVPHAGLKYSGQLATEAWKSCEIPTTIIIISPKHTGLGADWSVSSAKHWELPGTNGFEIDQELSRKIASRVTGMELDAAAHLREHGAEVQLPILDRLSATKAVRPRLVCIAMGGGANWSDIDVAAKKLSEVLREEQGKVLLVISSDMNHFSAEEENRRKDRLALDALKTGDAKLLFDTCRKNEISMCGVVPAAFVMQTLKELGITTTIEELGYDTSASVTGDSSRVVGYAAARWREING
jgi:AmmeMemoRadiSam system radical SAM enzyme/AmmeMemoRadiSam system protein B/AmmeMemoRadiSam system protein A